MKITEMKFDQLVKEAIKETYDVSTDNREKERIWNQIQLKKTPTKKKRIYPFIHIGVAAVLLMGFMFPRLRDKMAGSTESTLTNINSSFSSSQYAEKGMPLADQETINSSHRPSPFNVPNRYNYISEKNESEYITIYTYQDKNETLTIKQMPKENISNSQHISTSIHDGTLITLTEKTIPTFIYQKNDVQWVVEGQLNEREMKKIVESIK